MTYRIKRVDGTDDEIADTIRTMHDLCFGNSAPKPDTDQDFWWLVYLEKEAMAFAQMVPASNTPLTGYLKRSGVMREHRGHGLQYRLIRVRETLARKLGWETVVTDTTDNIPSANTLIKAGYRLFQPHWPWAFDHSLYWRKKL